jgi:hypothetical protein
MTINVVFKTPDALVFATDGLSTLSDVDAQGRERLLSSVESVEKLVVLSKGSMLAMFNGVGSFGNGEISGELRAYDAQRPRKRGEPVEHYVERLNKHLLLREKDATILFGAPPRPFHLMVGGFDANGGKRLPARVFEIKWKHDEPAPADIRPVLHQAPGDEWQAHSFGAYYAGATEALGRFDSGYDPALPQQAAIALAGAGGAASPPGILEELIHEARQGAPAAGGIMPSSAVQALARRYAGRIVQELFQAEPASMSEHYSLQAAINYCVFLTQCAYARENWSPARRGPPRVGSKLQVAYLVSGQPAEALCAVEPEVNANSLGGITWPRRERAAREDGMAGQVWNKGRGRLRRQHQ